MDINTRAKRDVARVSQHTSLTFYKTINVDEVTVKGRFSRIHLAVDPNTNTFVNSRKVQVTVSEQLLLAEGYVVRNASGEVAMLNHFCKCIDSTGVEKTYKITEQFPDDTVGLIVFTLGSVKL